LAARLEAHLEEVVSMSAIISGQSIETPPAPQERALAEQHAARSIEVARNRVVKQVGFWAAILTAVFALGWEVAETVASGFNVPVGAWAGVGRFAPSLFLALAYIALLVAIREWATSDRRIWASLAVQFATLYAALNATAYFVQLTLIIPHQLRGDLGALAPFVLQSGRYLFAVDVFGYTLMSLAAACVAPVFAGARSRLERWIFWLLLANGLFAVAGPVVMMFTSQGVSLMILWAAIWTLLIPVPSILLAALFWREVRTGA
jgi:hypothetical protein